MQTKTIYNENWKFPAARQRFIVRGSISVTARPRTPATYRENWPLITDQKKHMAISQIGDRKFVKHVSTYLAELVGPLLWYSSYEINDCDAYFSFVYRSVAADKCSFQGCMSVPYNSESVLTQNSRLCSYTLHTALTKESISIAQQWQGIDPNLAIIKSFRTELPIHESKSSTLSVCLTYHCQYIANISHETNNHTRLGGSPSHLNLYVWM
jgi:hypothetical protein